MAELFDEEENEYLKKYFPEGDPRRGDALVLMSFMKKKLLDSKS